jgi:hypothetical protein
LETMKTCSDAVYKMIVLTPAHLNALKKSDTVKPPYDVHTIRLQSPETVLKNEVGQWLSKNEK